MLPVDIELPEIEIGKLTEGIVNGEGVFDQLMGSVNAQILDQFQSDRINSDNYGTVYLGSLQAVLQQSVAFLLSKDKAAYDAALSLTQIKKVIEETELIKAQLLYTEAQTDQIRQNISVSIDEQTLIPFQRDKLSQEILLMEGQVIKIGKENLLIDNQISKMTEEILVLKQEVLVKEQDVLQSKSTIEKTDKEILLLSQQILNAQEGILKSKAEIGLLEQRKVTEIAQTVDGATGIIGSQRELYKAQTKGFEDDSIRKGVKASNDVYAIAKSNDPDAVSDPTNMLSTLEYFLTTMQQKQAAS